MLANIRNRKEKGFTIIEILIVLAIAGLILLVVFLAVPALQRNARNTQRREDVGNILSGVQEYVSNNGGNLPASVAVSGGTLTIGASGSNQVPVNLGYYNGSSSVTLQAAASGVTNGDDVNSVKLITAAVCSTTTVGDGTTTGASSRSIVALYKNEPSAKLCQAS